MVDDMTPHETAAVPDGTAAVDPASKQGFMSTTLGKVVVIGGAAVVLLTILGVVAFFLVTSLFLGAAQDVVTDMADGIESQITSGTISADPAQETAATEPGDVPLSSIFTFRDVFDPLIKAPDEETSTVGALDPDFVPEPDTLYLLDIVVENDVSLAVLLYNDALVSVPEGGVVASTPWMVLTINSGSVTMLYGDSQVTLVVGQGVSSK